jgi:hypothetical protein
VQKIYQPIAKNIQYFHVAGMLKRHGKGTKERKRGNKREKGGETRGN